MGLSQAQVQQFRDDGVLVVEGLLNEEEVRILRERAEWVARGEASYSTERHVQVEPEVAAGEAAADSRAGSVRKLMHLAFVDEVFEAHARNPGVLDCIEGLLGPDVKLYQDQLFMKPARIGSRQPYHQDQPLGFHIEPASGLVACWAALDHATVDNGCLWFLPGTHKQGVLDNRERAEFEELSLAGKLPRERPVELKPGDCSFHHGHVLHSSRANVSGRRRRGYATHYVSARCRYTGPEGKNDAMLVRGRSIPGCI